MTLIPEAERAEEIADGLAKFRGPNSDQIQHINAAISELNALSFGLRDLNSLLLADRGRLIRDIEDDLDLVHSSIIFTLRDVWTLLGKIGNGQPGALVPSDYRQTWREIERYGRSTRSQTLTTHLGIYKQFVFALCRILQRFVQVHKSTSGADVPCRQPPSRQRLDGLRDGVLDIRTTQHRCIEEPLEEAMGQLSLTPRGEWCFYRHEGASDEPSILAHREADTFLRKTT